MWKKLVDVSVSILLTVAAGIWAIKAWVQYEAGKHEDAMFMMLFAVLLAILSKD